MKLSEVKAILKEKKELATKFGGQWLDDLVALQNMIRNGEMKEQAAVETITLKNDRVRLMGGKPVTEIKLGDMIVSSHTGRGSSEVMQVQKVVSIKEVSPQFMEINGRKMKKTTNKRTFQGYGKMIG
ncbi:hypothetical protein ABIC37_005382 [Priestia megaterium]|uniref:hypothetical protein n=1 Tax=Priestia megaterium TaxID=1404 RepID=UPI00339B596D